MPVMDGTEYTAICSVKDTAAVFGNGICSEKNGAGRAKETAKEKPSTKTVSGVA